MILLETTFPVCFPFTDTSFGASMSPVTDTPAPITILPSLVSRVDLEVVDLPNGVEDPPSFFGFHHQKLP